MEDDWGYVNQIKNALAELGLTEGQHYDMPQNPEAFEKALTENYVVVFLDNDIEGIGMKQKGWDFADAFRANGAIVKSISGMGRKGELVAPVVERILAVRKLG